MTERVHFFLFFPLSFFSFFLTLIFYKLETRMSFPWKSHPLWPMPGSVQSWLFETHLRHFDLKCVIIYKSVILSPLSIKFRFEHISLKNLLTNFVCWAVAGHISETNFWLLDNWAKDGFIRVIFAKTQLRVFENLSQTFKKWNSVSTNFSLGFLSTWQYAQKRWSKGVIGCVLRPSSEARQCALILSLVNDDLWFLFLTFSTYGSFVKLSFSDL